VLLWIDGYTNCLKQEMTRICVAGTGEPLVSFMIDLQKKFSGPRAHLLPDLAVQWAPREPAKSIHSPTVGKIEARLQTGRGGNHTCDSFALFYGDTVTGDGAPSVRAMRVSVAFLVTGLGGLLTIGKLMNTINGM
jgi:hypothetical protein